MIAPSIVHQTTTLFEQSLTALLEAHRAEIQELCNDPRWNMLNASGLAYNLRRLPDGCYGVIVLDLDDMKGMNTRYGHSGLDSRMQRVSAALTMRNGDIIRGRIGWGDEIAIILPRVDVEDAAHRLLDALRAEGLSATMVFLRDAQGRYEDAIERMQDMVDVIKQDRKGVIEEVTL